MNDERKSSTSGVPQGIAGVICYFLPLIGGIVFLFLEKENKLVRFHAAQSILLWIAFFIIYVVLSWIFPLLILITIVFIIILLFIMYQALMEREYLLPVIGRIAKKQIYGDNNPEV